MVGSILGSSYDGTVLVDRDTMKLVTSKAISWFFSSRNTILALAIDEFGSADAKMFPY